MDGVKIWKSWKIAELTMRCNREKHAMLADVEERQEQDVICIDDITGKELP